MKIDSDSRQRPSWSRHVSAQTPAGRTAAPNDFQRLVQRFLAYKPEHQFKVLSARLKAHQLRVVRQAVAGAMECHA